MSTRSHQRPQLIPSLDTELLKDVRLLPLLMLCLCLVPGCARHGRAIQEKQEVQMANLRVGFSASSKVNVQVDIKGDHTEQINSRIKKDIIQEIGYALAVEGKQMATGDNTVPGIRISLNCNAIGALYGSGVWVYSGAKVTGAILLTDARQTSQSHMVSCYLDPATGVNRVYGKGEYDISHDFKYKTPFYLQLQHLFCDIFGAANLIKQEGLSRTHSTADTYLLKNRQKDLFGLLQAGLTGSDVNLVRGSLFLLDSISNDEKFRAIMSRDPLVISRLKDLAGDEDIMVRNTAQRLLDRLG